MKLLLRILFVFLVVFSIVFFYKSGISKQFTYNNIENMKNILLSKYNLLLPIIIIVLYVLFNIVGLPTMYFSILMGYLYNFWIGLIIALSGMILGIMSSFLLSKYLFKDFFFFKFRHNKYYKMLIDWTNYNEIKTIFFSRLIFIIPYNIQNFMYGITNVSIINYFIFTLLGITPITLLNVLTGILLKMNLNNNKNIGLIMLIAITIAFIILFTIIIKSIYNKNMEKKYGKQ